MAGGRPEVSQAVADLGGDVDAVLDDLGLPAGVLDDQGRFSWANERAREFFGDLTGRPLTDLFAPESHHAAALAYSKKLLGHERTTNAERWLRLRDGGRVLAEVHAVSIRDGQRVVGVFGVVAPTKVERPPPRPDRKPLTPREAEVLHYLSEGFSTEQIAGELSIARETVRNHIRFLLRKLGVHSRIEALAEARRRGLLD
jgi:PAS domain S-box-containing protein